jgi:7-cyano-7-deazaguanine synthase in queuosine biosynthesis
MLDSSDELVNPSAASLSHPSKEMNQIFMHHFKYKSKQKKKEENHTSISARGVRADTESIQMRSIAPDLHMRSATDREKVQANQIYNKKSHNNF